jgi:hypothetical protein
MRLPAALNRSDRLFPLALLFVCGVAYAYLLPQMGFYWDDWQALFLSRFDDPQAYSVYYALDRPFSAWTYQWMMPLLDARPIAWQLATLLLRWLSGIGLWLTLRGVWPERKALVNWMALLFVLYPGFLQQPIAVAYSQHFTTYALFTLSLAAMVWAVRLPRWRVPLLVASFLAALAHLATMEYFAGLELLRTILLWILLRRAEDRPGVTLRRVLPFGLPLLIPFLAFVAWRIVIFPRVSAYADVNSAVWLADLRANPLAALLSLLQTAGLDTLHLLVFAWLEPLAPDSVASYGRVALFALTVSALLAGLTGWWLYRLGGVDQDRTHTPSFYRQALILGLAAIALGGFTYWVTGVRILSGLWSDRFSLAPLFGVVILVVAGVDWLVRTRAQRAWMLGLLVGVSLLAQMLNTYTYRQNWKQQLDFYQELAWRIPGLQPGTALLTEKMPINRVAEYSVAYALNAIYAGRLDSFAVPYWYFSALNHEGDSIEGFAPGLSVRGRLRMVDFSSTTSQTVVLKYQPDEGCLRLLSEIDHSAPDLTENERRLLAISNPEQVISAQASPLPVEIFGAPPASNWCAYYEAADLARYRADWQAVTRLWGQARGAGLEPYTAMELVPFLEGFGITGDWATAEAITVEGVGLGDQAEALLCDRWSWLLGQTAASAERSAAVSRVAPALGCPLQP